MLLSCGTLPVAFAPTGDVPSATPPLRPEWLPRGTRCRLQLLNRGLTSLQATSVPTAAAHPVPPPASSQAAHSRLLQPPLQQQYGEYNSLLIRYLNVLPHPEIRWGKKLIYLIMRLFRSPIFFILGFVLSLCKLKTMKGKTTSRVFVPGIPVHIYKASSDFGIIFYTDIDMLMLYSIEATLALKYGITIISACYMFNHIHRCEIAPTKDSMTEYEGETASLFSRLYNQDKSRAGKLWLSPFGSAIKRDGKNVRACINYIHNNAPEKKLCTRAVQYKWDFLAYAADSHPFSKKYVQRDATKKMKQCVQSVRMQAQKGNHLDYLFLKKAKLSLDKTEWLQLIDIIITSYHLVNYAVAAKYFGSMKNLMTAPDDNTGKEFDIKEDFGSSSFLPYCRMFNLVINKGYDDFSPYRLTEEEKGVLYRLFRSAGVPFEHITRFLHYSLGR